MLISVFIFADSSASVEGVIEVAGKDELPAGYFGKAAGYLPGDSVSITNPNTGITLQILNLGTLDASGGIAVKVFFILSGFWVTQSFLKSESIKEYSIKRFKKILPQYWLVVLVFAVGLSAFSVLSLREYFCNSVFYKYLAANILTLNFIQPNLPGVFEGLALNGSVNGSLWTIKIEIGFYILLPFIVFAVKRLREKFNGGGTNVLCLPRCMCFPFCTRFLCRL